MLKPSFPNISKEYGDSPSSGKWEIILGAIFLSGSGDLNGSNFGHLNFFQSYKQRFVNIEYRLKSKLPRTIRKASIKLK